MDPTRFDELTRTLSGLRSRRHALKALTGATLGALGLAARGVKAGPAGQVAICHRTGSATNPFEYLRVSPYAVPAHAAHGDAVDVDLTSDVNNCGTCGNVCTTDVTDAVPFCEAGVCGFACADDYVESDGACVLDCAPDPVCNGTCCRAGQCLANNECCPTFFVCGTTCCRSGICCANGTCCSSGTCCGGTCCIDGTCCGGTCCKGGGTCINGLCVH